ncbi:MAG: hypothetical protein ACREYE_25915 [Gammaproteobacteria bacterium]
MSKKTSLSSHQYNTLVRLAQGATLMVDSENRIWIDQQRIFANTFFALRTRNLIARLPQAIVGQKVFRLSEEGRELLNGICIFPAARRRWVRAETASPGIEPQGVVATEQGSDTKLGSPFHAPDLAPRSQRPNTELNWFAWAFLAALTGLVVVFLTT